MPGSARICAAITYPADVICVVEYDQRWSARFEALREEYTRAMELAGVPMMAIEHVGSTAVPGLAAKPIIDIDVVVAEQHMAPATDVLISLGFRPLGEQGIPHRLAFKEPAHLGDTNTYVILENPLSLHNHLCLRDTLRADPALRDGYANVKRTVAAVAADIDEYGRGKNDMIQEILAAAGMTAEERDSINGNQVPSQTELPP